MNKDQLLSKTISFLRFPLIVGVVFIHFSLVNGIDVHGSKLGLNNPDWYFFVVNLISEVIAKIAVPLFFFFSGFLFFYKKDFNLNVYKSSLSSRVRTLLVPYLLWNLIAILWQLKCYIPGLSTYCAPVEMQISPLRVLNTFFCNSDVSGIFVNPSASQVTQALYPINVPLWFLRNLMILVIVTPLVHWLIKRLGQFIYLLAGIWVACSLFAQDYAFLEEITKDLFFFSWGAYFSINKKSFVTAFGKSAVVAILYVVVAVVDAKTKGMKFNGLINDVGIVLGIIAVVWLSSSLLEKQKVRVNTTLTNASFFIFAMHGIFIDDVGKAAMLFLHIPDNNPWTMLCLYFCVPVVVILICLGVCLVLKRYIPGLHKLLTGGR